MAVLWIDLKTHSWGCKRIEMNLTDNNNIVKKLEKDDRLDFDAILEKGKHLYVNKNIYLNLYVSFSSKITQQQFSLLFSFK